MEPVYQIGQPFQGTWRDASKDVYDVCMPSERRIIYTAAHVQAMLAAAPIKTLEEAIAHAKEKAKGNSACAMEHSKLAAWLTELQLLRAAQAAPVEAENEIDLLAEAALCERLDACLAAARAAQKGSNELIPTPWRRLMQN